MGQRLGFLAAGLIMGFFLGLAVARTLLGFLPAGLAPPAGPDGEYRVLRVIDGDTIVVEGGERVRYLGVDAPETQGSPECYGREATERNRQLVEGKRVRLEADRRDRDRYGRLLRWVWVDGTLVNEQLIREGYATVYRDEPAAKYMPQLLAAEAEARSRGAGLWSACRRR
jgi:micrococcal nuclease